MEKYMLNTQERPTSTRKNVSFEDHSTIKREGKEKSKKVWFKNKWQNN